jgi:hypothetical protein
MDQGDKERFTKFISISMEKPLITRDRCGFLTVIIVDIRDEIVHMAFYDHLSLELFPHMS